jgi:hypothetical protein
MDAITQLIGQEAINKFAEAMRLPITEVAREFMPSVRDLLMQEHALRIENERLATDNRQLRERPTAGLTVSAEATIVPPLPSIEIPFNPRVSALAVALEDIGKVSDSASAIVTKAKPRN